MQRYVYLDLQTCEQFTNGNTSIYNDFNSNSEDADSIEKDLQTLVKKFPACDKSELQNVLEANSFCLEDAIAAIEVFSLPEKKSNSGSKNHSKKVIDFNEVVDCVVIDDDNENEPAVNGNNPTTLLSGEFIDLTNIFMALMSKIG